MERVDFVEYTFNVMKRWVVIEEKNRLRDATGYFAQYSWKTGRMPKLKSSHMDFGEGGLKPILKSLTPPLVMWAIKGIEKGDMDKYYALVPFLKMVSGEDIDIELRRIVENLSRPDGQIVVRSYETPEYLDE